MKEETKDRKQLSEVSPQRHRRPVMKSSVFERLYRKSKKRLESKSPLARSKSARKVNYGELLYHRGMKNKEKVRGILKQREAEQVTEENCPFKPKINELSNMLSPRYFEKTEDLLLRKSESYKSKLFTLIEENLSEEMKECTFSPQILKSRSPMRNTQSKTEFRYQDSRKRQQRRQLITQTVFKLNSAVSPPRNGRYKSPSSQEAWADKMTSQKRDFEQRMKRLKEVLDAKEVSQNGTAFYRPATGRSPKSRKDGLSIHEYLYSKRTERQSRATFAETHQQSEWDKLAGSVKVNSHSVKLFEKFRGKIYARVFSLLDCDADGKISTSTVSVEAIDNSVLEIIFPILKTLEMGEEMHLREFVGHMEQLWNTLNPTQKGILMKIDTEFQNEPTQAGTHRIHISPKSRKYAQQKNSLASSDIYERMVQWNELNDLKRAKKREINANAELRQCTFSPTIKVYKREK